MKKFLMTFAAAVFCAMSATMFTACGSDNDDNNGGKPGSNPGTGGNTGTTTVKDSIPTKVKFGLEVVETEDILKYCNVSVEYNDGTGAKTEAVTTCSWQKFFESKVPATYTLKKIVTVKDSAGLASAAKISFYTGAYKYSYALYNAANEVIVARTNSLVVRGDAGDKADLIKGIKDGELNSDVTFKVDAKGNVTETNNKTEK